MVSKIAVRTQTQRIPESGISGRVTNAHTGLYTCPAGKKAAVEGTMVLDALGADAKYAIAVKRGSQIRAIGSFVGVNQESKGRTVLNAGDILTVVGDGGSTNGTADMDAIIRELPA